MQRKKTAKNKSPSALARALLTWYAREKRDMPWRRTRDPYRIWLSEIMLQQTQVNTVIPYYEKFTARFPTVQALAAAPLDDVLMLWAGLGYYSRARNLHRGAQVIVENFGGKLPDSQELIREIPGIGAYTAGAILSIAYSKPEPLVDGNVARVLSRIFLLKGDYRKQGKAAVWASAGGLLQSCRGDPGDLNQALMELGATVCTPSAPQCARCPVAKFCLAKKQGKQAAYPELEQKASAPTWRLRAWIVQNKSAEILLAQREPRGLFGGLWEVPTEKIDAAKKGAAPLAKTTHVLTHRVLEIDICRADKPRIPAPGKFPCWSGAYTQYRWLKPAQILSGKEIGLASAQKKVLKAFLAANERTLF